MSHFSVLVIAKDVAAALQPFHEFECTGVNDQYIQEVDLTGEALETFAASTETRLRAPDGTLHGFFGADGAFRPEFSRPDPDAPDWAHDRRKAFVPPGYEQIEIPAAQVGNAADWAEEYYGLGLLAQDEAPDVEDEHKFGYVEVDAAGGLIRVVDRTNPNKRWDWWTEGGRWSDKLLLKDGSRCNSAAAGDVDWDGMIAAKGAEAAVVYDTVMSVIAGRQLTTWAQALARHKAGEITIDAARELYNGQPIVKELLAAKAIDPFGGAETLSEVVASERADYVRQKGETNASTWALLREDGTWTERGEMGWFGMSSADDQSTARATSEFWDVVRALPDDARVTVVDCHI